MPKLKHAVLKEETPVPPSGEIVFLETLPPDYFKGPAFKTRSLRDKPIDPLSTPLTEATEIQSLQDYLTIIHHNHKKNVTLTKKELAIIFLPAAVSILIGGVAAWGLMGAAEDAAEGDTVLSYLIQGSSLQDNLVINAYYFNEVSAPLFEAAFIRKPKDYMEAIYRLQGLQPGLIAKIQRGALTFLNTTTTSALALVTSLPAMAFDIKKSHDPLYIATMVLLANAALQYKSTQALGRGAYNLIYSPFQKLYRKFNEEARNIHKISTTVSLLKNAHKEALQAANKLILQMLQTKKYEGLEEIYSLLLIEKEKLTREDSIKLLLKILELTEKKLAKDKDTLGTNTPFVPSPLWRFLFQSLSVALVLISLPPYYLTTIEAVADFTGYGELLSHMIGFIVFAFSAFLALDVGYSVAGVLYDLSTYALHGIWNSWKQSKSTYEFLKNAWDNKFNPESWYHIFQASLPIIQNGKPLLSLVAIKYIAGLLAPRVSTYLNKLTFGEAIADWINPPTAISIFLFNQAPTLTIMGSGQQLLARTLGSAQQKIEIMLVQFITNCRTVTDQINDDVFLSMLQSIEKIPNYDAEKLISRFVGGKTPADIFAKDKPEYTKWKFVEIIPNLITEKVNVLERYKSLRENNRSSFWGMRRREHLLGSGSAKEVLSQDKEIVTVKKSASIL